MFSLNIASLVLVLLAFAIFHTKQFENRLQLCLVHAIYSEIILLHSHFPLNILCDLMKKIFEKCVKDAFERVSFSGIDNWVQSWVSWVEPGFLRKPIS